MCGPSLFTIQQVVLRVAPRTIERHVMAQIYAANRQPLSPPSAAALWCMWRHLGAAMSGTTRAAAMALMCRASLLPRSLAAAGASAYTDLLLFERSMRRNYLQFAEGAGRGGVAVGGWGLGPGHNLMRIACVPVPHGTTHR